jgi:hypothetical protein
LQLDSDEEEFRDTARQIREKKASIKKISQDKNKLSNRPIIPRKHQSRTLSQLTTTLKSVGLDTSRIEERAKAIAKSRGLGVIGGLQPRGLAVPGEKRGKRSLRARMEAEAEEMMDAANGSGSDEEMEVDEDEEIPHGPRTRKGAITAASFGNRTPQHNRATAGLTTAEYEKSNELRNFAQRPRNYKVRRFPFPFASLSRLPFLHALTHSLPLFSSHLTGKVWRGRSTHRHHPSPVAARWKGSSRLVLPPSPALVFLPLTQSSCSTTSRATEKGRKDRLQVVCSLWLLSSLLLSSFASLWVSFLCSTPLHHHHLYFLRPFRLLHLSSYLMISPLDER